MGQTSIFPIFRIVYTFKVSGRGLGHWGGGDGEESQGFILCMKNCLLKCTLVVEILEGGSSFKGNIQGPSTSLKISSS